MTHPPRRRCDADHRFADQRASSSFAGNKSPREVFSVKEADFPQIVAALTVLPVRSCLIDDEAVVCDANGLAVFDLPGQSLPAWIAAAAATGAFSSGGPSRIPGRRL